MAMESGYEGGGGAGGKFRKRPFKRPQTTPYDRPPLAVRPSHNNNNNGWLSKLVDPASKLITAGAHKLFSSVFRKRLLPPPDEKTEIRDSQPEAKTVVVPSNAKESALGGNDPTRISDSRGVVELEDILKQKTFTRSEIDHLRALLLSRTVDNSVGVEKGMSEPTNPDSLAVHGKQESRTNLPIHEIGTEHVAPGATPTPAMRSKVFEEDVASPAELAKAYMGSRPTKVSPSVLGSQNQMLREDFSGPYNRPFKLRSPASSLSQKPGSDIGTSENGYMTPRPRGRSAIYSMARTPYSKIHSTAALKVAETASDGRSGSLLSHYETENNLFSGSKKQALKRRSSVLESDIGSVGPIRRIRQKPNLLHPKSLTLPYSGGPRATHGSGAVLDATDLPSSSNWSSHSHSMKSVTNKSMPSTSNGYVPSQSIEMAQKIFQQLDKFTPKGKSPELEIDMTGGNSPAKMTPAMLGGLARKSMETIDSLKVLQSVQDSKNANGSVVSGDPHVSSHKMSPNVEETSLKRSDVFSDSVAPRNGAEARIPTSHSSQKMKIIDSMVSQSVFDHPPKKRAFQMSAHEDYLEADDDEHPNGAVSTPLTEGGDSIDLSKKSVVIPLRPSQNEAIAVEKPPVPEQKPSANPLFSKESEPQPAGSMAAGNAAGFTFSVAPSSSPTTSMGVQEAVTAPQSALGSDKVGTHNESNKSVPVFSTKSEKLPLTTFSVTSVVSFQKDPKLELPSSGFDTAAAKVNGAVENDKSTQVTVDVSKKSEDVPAPVLSTAKGVFNFGLPANNTTLNNGLPSTVPTTSVASSPFLFSGSSSHQSSVPVTFPVSPLSPSSDSSSLSNGFAASTSTSAIATATAGIMGSTATVSSMTSFSTGSGQGSSSETTPSVSPGPSFLFGSSAAPPSSTPLGSSVSKSTENSAAKSTEAVFGSTSGSLFSTSSSATANGGNDLGFNASTLKPATGKAAPAASNGSIFGFQAASPTAPFSASTQSFPSQFPASTSSSVFGLTGASNFSSGGSVFATNTISSSSASASSSLGASLTSPAVSSSSGAASSIFGSTWQPSKPTIPSSTFSTSPAAVFSFGASASRSSTDASKTPVLFGSSAPSSSAAGNSTGFQFGAASSTAAPVFPFSSATSTSVASAAPSSSQPAFGSMSSPFAFSSTPSGNNDQMSMEDSMAEDSMQAPTPAAPVFGQQPVSAPPTGFMFGATSSPAFGATSSPAFGATSSPAFGATSSPAFGGAAAPSTGSPFQFGNQPNQMAPQSASPFQPSGSVEFNAGGAGSFSLGTGGGDKSNRKIVKVKGRLRRK